MWAVIENFSKNSATLAASKKLTLTSSKNPVKFGEPVTQMAGTVPVIPPSTGTATGTASFYKGSTLLGTILLNKGKATLSLSNLSRPHDLRGLLGERQLHHEHVVERGAGRELTVGRGGAGAAHSAKRSPYMVPKGGRTPVSREARGDFQFVRSPGTIRQNRSLSEWIKQVAGTENPSSLPLFPLTARQFWQSLDKERESGSRQPPQLVSAVGRQLREPRRGGDRDLARA
jgi:hypothetical protein